LKGFGKSDFFGGESVAEKKVKQRNDDDGEGERKCLRAKMGYYQDKKDYIKQPFGWYSH